MSAPKYRHAHQRARAAWAPTVRAGRVHCARCGRRIHPRDSWDLGHTDDGTDYNGPEHAACNRSAAGKKRQRQARDPQPRPVTRW